MDFFNNCELISLSEIPSNGDWCFPPLYKKDSNNNVRSWQIGYSSQEKVLITKAGTLAKPQYYESDVVPKGKKSYVEQAIQQAKRDHLDKNYEGYVPDSYEEEYPIPLVEPMRANEYKPPTEGGRSNLKEFPVYIQRKLDGIRLLTYMENGKIRMNSRKSRDLNFSSEHYVNLKKELELFFNYVPPRSQLDGELYKHGLTFNHITSIVKTQKFVHTDIDLIEYHIFDIIESQNLPYNDRYDILVNAYNTMIEENNIAFRYIKLVESFVVESYEGVEEKLEEFLEEGYEGLIIRKVCFEPENKKCLESAQYKNRRTTNILKYKTFKDDEMTITDVVECKGNEKGLCKIVGITDDGITITVRPSEEFETRQDWLENPQKIIGKRYTYKYSSVNPETGQPRFATGKSLRDYE